MGMLLLLSACKDKQDLQDLKKYVAHIRETLTIDSKNSKSLELQLPQAVTYQSAAFAQADNNDENASNQKIVNPLLAYPIKSFQFTGVMTQGEITWAYLVAPNNNIYQVKEGDTLGNNYGKIVKINPNRVEVKEKGLDNKKKPVERIVILQLKD